VTTVVLVRHGLTKLTGPVLAGWTPDLHLDERGAAQAAAVAERLRPLAFDAVVSSPLDRCLDTATAVLQGRDQELQVDERLGECRYGDWTGRPLKELAKDPLWKVVQAHPSAVVFPGPGGRGAAGDPGARRERRAGLERPARPGRHLAGLLARRRDQGDRRDAMGLHLDLFQRIAIDPCSVTVLRYTELRPFVVRVNDTGGGVADLLPPKRKGRRRRSSDAVGGGGAAAGQL
jgi:probable phosphoglycerate mutase